jgi:hypothetical protein
MHSPLFLGLAMCPTEIHPELLNCFLLEGQLSGRRFDSVAIPYVAQARMVHGNHNPMPYPRMACL